jgi:hypothetical protein
VAGRVAGVTTAGRGDPSAAEDQREAPVADAPVTVGEAAGYALRVFLAVRIGLAVVALAATALLPPQEPVGVSGWPPPQPGPGIDNAVTAWERFDALWFLRIADSGYRDGDGSAAFFPLYPMLVRGVSVVVGGHPLAAGLLVSNAALAAALAALYLLVARESSRRVARRTVLYLAIFPSALFFLAPYSESVFLLLVLLSFLAARSARWPLAGLAGAGAALTRSAGLMLVPALVVEAASQLRRARGPSRWVALLWACAPAVGTAGYLWFWERLNGAGLTPFRQQGQWQREPAMPVATLVEGTRQAFRWFGVYAGGYHLLDWLIVVPCLVLAVVAAMRLRPSYAVYAWGSILLPLSFVFPDRPLMSMPRFLAVVFPLHWALATVTERRPGAHEAAVAVSAGLLGLLTVLYVGWYFVF